MAKDILCIKENREGRDFIIGDVHGNRQCLDEVLACLKPGDRLFIVGDLTDRGHDSPGVLSLLQKNKNRIFSVRGNHEDQCLDTMDCLERLALKESLIFTSDEFLQWLKDKYSSASNLFTVFNEYENSKCAEEYKHLKFDLKHDRMWLVDLFHRELKSGSIQLIDDDIEGKNLIYKKNSRVGCIWNYMSHLPYIIHVSGKNPFNVVHADMPFNNSELMERIKQGDVLLTEKERKHATWARDDEELPFQKKAGGPAHMMTYVGHNIITEDNTLIIRRESKTANLDVATYSRNCSLMVNHTNTRSRFVGSGKPSEELLTKKEELDYFLSEIRMKQGVLMEQKIPQEQHVPAIVSPNREIVQEISAERESADCRACMIL